MIKKIILSVFLALPAVSIAMAGVWKAPDQEKAKERAKQVVPFISEYKDEGKISRKISLMDAGVSLKDVTDVYFLLDSPLIKKNRRPLRAGAFFPPASCSSDPGLLQVSSFSSQRRKCP